MRVLILANNDIGLYKFRYELLRELLVPGSYLEGRSAEPCEVYISLPNGDFVPELVKLGCQFINTSFDRHGTNPLQELKLRGQYLKIVREVVPDIVFSYTIKPNIYGGMACKALKIPCIMNITGLGTAVENGGMMQKLMLLLYRLALPGARKVFFQNAENMEFMQKNGIGVDKSSLLPGSGVDLLKHPFVPYPTENYGIKFLMVGRIMRDKGIEEFLYCAKTLHQKWAFVSFTLVGGFDDEQYRPVVQAAVDAGEIRYLGIRSDVPLLMAQHHCIIHPSYHEGMSNVLLEAAACGRPVLASNVPGCRETFAEGVSGFGFDAKNSTALVACVEKFLGITTDERVQMGLAGREKMVHEFSREIVVQAYMNEIQQLEVVGNDHL